MLLTTIFLQVVNNDPFQSFESFLSNTFSKEMLATAFVVLFIIAIGAMAWKNSYVLAATVAIITLAIIEFEVGLFNFMEMPMMHTFIIGVVLAIIAFRSAMVGEEKKHLKGMGHTGRTVARTEYPEW